MRKTALIAALLAPLFLGAGCAPKEQDPPDGPPQEEEHLSFLHAEGEQIADEAGNRLALRGVNAGGLGVIETWMTGFQSESRAPNDGSPGGDVRVRDHLTVTKVLSARFGEEAAEALWYNYRLYWWTEEDFENCEDMGINVIRLPFTYMNVDFAAAKGLEYAGKAYDFTFLDDFVSRAEAHGIYTILDLHGAYGSHNGQDHSGETLDSAGQVDFYSNEQKLSLTEKLWGAVAEHFKDNPAVAGYDLLNEPGEKGGNTKTPHWNAMDRFYDAVRAAGDEHIVIFESCWAGGDLPYPSEYGWENCMYSFHHYTNCWQDGQEYEHFTSFQSRLSEVREKQFGVPLYMGEFSAYNSEKQWDDTLKMLNNYGWSWTIWTYKVWQGNGGWGIYSVGGEKVRVHTDSKREIENKFRTLKTENGEAFTFYSGRTLKDCVKDHSGGEA